MSPKRTTGMLYFGEERAPQTELVLCAGPLQLLFHNGGFRYIRLGSREILRAVYLAVRDPAWKTIPATLIDLNTHIGVDYFQVSYGLVHRQGDIDFRWTVDVAGSPDGTIHWNAEGKARTAFEANRIGICVLHPIAECAGRPCIITHSGGDQEHSTFPHDVAPHQPFLDVREMVVPVDDKASAKLIFKGDIFETEDQRNWTDASFKTYSTPLSLPYPLPIHPGESRRQSVTLHILGHRSADIVEETNRNPIKLTLLQEEGTKLPKIGIRATNLGTKSVRPLTYRLNNLKIDYLSSDVRIGDQESEESLWQSSDQANLFGLPLEVAINVESDFRRAAQFVEEVKRRNVKVCRWLAYCHAFSLDQTVAASRLESVAPVVLGSGPNFAELNRNLPVRLMQGGVWFSANPQMHGTDDATLIENLAAQADVVRSLRHWADKVPISVSPITFKPQMPPSARFGPVSNKQVTVPQDWDPRQTSLFGAAWTLGSIKHLAEAGANTVTYFELFGCKGLMPFPTLADMVYPMYHVFADVLDFKDAEVMRIESSQPLVAEGFALRMDNRIRIMMASFVPRTVSVEIALNRSIGKLEVRKMDEQNAEFATRDPEWHRHSAEPLGVGETLSIELKPFGLATITATLCGELVSAANLKMRRRA